MKIKSFWSTAIILAHLHLQFHSHLKKTICSHFYHFHRNMSSSVSTTKRCHAVKEDINISTDSQYLVNKSHVRYPWIVFTNKENHSVFPKQNQHWFQGRFTFPNDVTRSGHWTQKYILRKSNSQRASSLAALSMYVSKRVFVSRFYYFRNLITLCPPCQKLPLTIFLV